jgi:hypothetical protein
VVISEAILMFLSGGQDMHRLPRNFLQTRSNYVSG